MRDELFRSHPQSPVPPEQRPAFSGIPYYPYDAAARVMAKIAPASIERFAIPSSAGGSFDFFRFASANFSLAGEDLTLGLFWLDAYPGGLFVSFRDQTSGSETYGACRYLLDTSKGADLGLQNGRLVLDFNFSYNPSCAYDPRWACPLAPSGNSLPVPIRAGERLL